MEFHHKFIIIPLKIFPPNIDFPYIVWRNKDTPEALIGNKVVLIFEEKEKMILGSYKPAF